jgi:hypothetical protein
MVGKPILALHLGEVVMSIKIQIAMYFFNILFLVWFVSIIVAIVYSITNLIGLTHLSWWALQAPFTVGIMGFCFYKCIKS